MSISTQALRMSIWRVRSAFEKPGSVAQWATAIWADTGRNSVEMATIRYHLNKMERIGAVAKVRFKKEDRPGDGSRVGYKYMPFDISKEMLKKIPRRA